MKADDLIIEVINGGADLTTLRQKLNALIDAHNAFVQHLFTAPDVPVFPVGMTETTKANCVPIANIAEGIMKNPMTLVNILAQLNNHQLLELRNVLIKWRYVCNCIAPTENVGYLLHYCEICRKVVQESDND